jgi:MSHA biogenesis protein MshL
MAIRGKYQMKKINNSGLFSLCLLVLMGCQSTPISPDMMKKSLDQALLETKQLNVPKALLSVPADLQQELMQQSFDQAQDGLLSEKRLEIAANNVPAQSFFSAIVNDSPYSIAVHPDVSGVITLNLKDVTIDEALDVIEELYGYRINRQNNVIQVYSAGMRTETIPLNYLVIERQGTSTTSVSAGGISGNKGSGGNSGGNGGNSGGNGGVNISTSSESDFWKELEETLTGLIGTADGRRVIVSPQAGLVTVRAFPQEIKTVQKFIDDTQTHLRRQVIIEAKIMEVTLNDDYQQGVKWDKVLGGTNLSLSMGGNITNNAISTLVGGTTAFGFQNNDFSGVIELLETQGNVQVLSSPRITVTNNQKAVIKVGEDEYFVTDISTTSTASANNTTVTPDISLTPFFSGIALDVTPQIDPSGSVILHVHPSVTLTGEQNKVISLGGEEFVLPLAQSSVRESDTIIKAQSGEIVVIGGLIETRNVDVNSQTPLLGNIPFLGELFKTKSQQKRKTELIIMLKPIVVGEETWNNQLQDARLLLKEWFPGDDTFEKK